MSLFPIAGTNQLPHPSIVQQQQQQGGEAPDAPGPAAWLSGNTSFRPGGGRSDSQQNPYGHYDSQGAFLRAAERYLEDSSSGEDDEVGGAPGGTLHGAAPAAAAAAPKHRVSTLKDPEQPVNDAAKRENTDVHGEGGQGRSADEGVASMAGRVRRALSSSSPSRSGSGSSSGSSDGSRGHRSRKRKHRSSRRKDRRSRSRSRSRKDSSSGKHSKKRKKARRDRDEEDEVEKIRRLERAAAAAGLAPRDAAALAAAKPLLKGAAPQPGELYYDTRGDLQNLVYESLYGGNVASYHRADPLGLARGARARRLLPGQVSLYGSTAGGATGAGVRLRYKSYGEDADADDEWAEEGAAGRGTGGGDPFGSRYFAGRTVALERSRRLKRVRMREEVVLPGQGSRLGGGSGGGGSGGSLVGADGSGGWLLSRVGGGAAAGRGSVATARAHDVGSSRLGLPLPAFLPLQDPATAAALAAAQVGSGRGVEAAAAALAAAAVEGESTEEWVLRRTREFNVAVRERPQDVQVGAGEGEEGLRAQVQRWTRRVGSLVTCQSTLDGFNMLSVSSSMCGCLVHPTRASGPAPSLPFPRPGPCYPTLHAAVAALRALPRHSGTAVVAAGC